MRELKTTNLSDFRVGWDLLQGPGKYVHDSCWGAQGFFLEAYRYNREKKRGVGRQLLRFWVSLTEGKWGSYKLCWTWGMEKTKPIFFFPGCCAWMLLFAYIMFVLATAPALKVARVTALSVVSIWKQGESGTSTSWLGAGPGASGAGFHPALAAGICLCPRCPWQEPAKRFMVLFIYLLLIDLFVCLLLGSHPVPA